MFCTIYYMKLLLLLLIGHKVFHLFSRCFRTVGHMVVPLYSLQWGPDPHQHYAALYAFHVQDAEYEHEA